jgi:hypothetical protein
VVIETGLFAKEKKQDYFTSRTNMAAMKRRYINKDFMVDMNSKTNRQAEPYYTALGRMVADTVSRERQKYLENINMRSQLQALVFTDSVVGYLKDDACRKQVEQSLAKGEYFDASLQAIDGFRKEVSLEELGKHFVKKC